MQNLYFNIRNPGLQVQFCLVLIFFDQEPEIQVYRWVVVAREEFENMNTAVASSSWASIMNARFQLCAKSNFMTFMKSLNFYTTADKLLRFDFPPAKLWASPRTKTQLWSKYVNCLRDVRQEMKDEFVEPQPLQSLLGGPSERDRSISIKW